MNTKLLLRDIAALALLFVIFMIPTGALAGTIEDDATASFSCSSVSEIPLAECNALVALYSKTNGPAWKNKSGWLVTTAPCSWYGVYCSSGHVAQLVLFDTGLYGFMPAELGNLVVLRNLNLNANLLVGSIPPELGRLTKLTALNLCFNQLTGPIPAELGNLKGLNDELMLYYNHLSGPIPKELGRLTRLRHFHAYNNELSGQIPPELGAMTSLVSLCLSSNRLSGSVPGNLSNLQSLLIDDNPLSDALPTSLTSRPLQRFWFNNTQLCEPGNLTFQNWLGGITDLRRMGVLCASVGINYPIGGPGSYFLITACGFPPNALATVRINGVTLGTVRTDSNGCVSLILATAQADSGYYAITITANIAASVSESGDTAIETQIGPSASATAWVSFTIAEGQPVRPQQGTGVTFEVPAGIAYTDRAFLPLIVR